MNILVTGGAGYIGSHTVLELLNEGHDVYVVDDLSSNSDESLKRVSQITGRPIKFYKFDLRDKSKLSKFFDSTKLDAVIHFAGLKVMAESIKHPLQYYSNNIESTLRLCEVMKASGIKKLIFSSSAAVYGAPSELPLKETSRVGVGITSPYGRTKFMLEQILKDISSADSGWQIALLRYFNPIGAHDSGRIGENLNGPPDNLLPYISQVAMGKLKKVNIFGNDYETPDGTGVRDYIHVVDLAKGHIAALKNLHRGSEVYNLGTGRGISVLELITAFETACGNKIPYAIRQRRPGDVGESYADCSKANKELGWKAEKTIEDACYDAWKWQSQNPNGY